MCWGNNGTTIYALDKDDQALITFEETLVCASNPDLAPSLRSKYVKLMIGKWTGMATSQENDLFFDFCYSYFHFAAQ